MYTMNSDWIGLIKAKLDVNDDSTSRTKSRSGTKVKCADLGLGLGQQTMSVIEAQGKYLFYSLKWHFMLLKY